MGIQIALLRVQVAAFDAVVEGRTNVASRCTGSQDDLAAASSTAVASGRLDAVDVARGLVNVLELAERGASEGGRALDRVQVRLHSWRLALDPQTREWVSEMRQGIADGSLDDQALDSQDLRGMIKAVRSAAT